MAAASWGFPAGPGASSDESKSYLQAVEEAEDESQRAIELAAAPTGIPSSGALTLLHNDPKTEGPRLFHRYCASCHTYVDEHGHGIDSKSPSAPNLYGFGSRAWVAKVLDPEKIASPEIFGNTAHKTGDMVNFVKDTFKDADKKEAAQLIAALSAEAQLPEQAELDQRDATTIADGRKLVESLTCTDCHKFHDVGDVGAAPDLTGYGSEAWLAALIADPTHARFYGDRNDRMPSFAEGADASKHLMRPHEMRMIVRWLRGDWYRAEK